jgi:hypothetical protein
MMPRCCFGKFARDFEVHTKFLIFDRVRRFYFNNFSVVGEKVSHEEPLPVRARCMQIQKSAVCVLVGAVGVLWGCVL